MIRTIWLCPTPLNAPQLIWLLISCLLFLFFISNSLNVVSTYLYALGYVSLEWDIDNIQISIKECLYLLKQQPTAHNSNRSWVSLLHSSWNIDQFGFTQVLCISTQLLWAESYSNHVMVKSLHFETPLSIWCLPFLFCDITIALDGRRYTLTQ